MGPVSGLQLSIYPLGTPLNRGLTNKLSQSDLSVREPLRHHVHDAEFLNGKLLITRC